MTEKPDPTIAELIRMPVVLRVPGMDQVDVRHDLVYKTVAGQTLHMDLYAPAGPAALHPAVILIHGGPIPRIGAKNMGIFVSYGKLLAASGFVAVGFDHRFLGPSRLQDASDDVAALVDHVRSQAGLLGVDADQLALWAFSGGGSLLAPFFRTHPAWLRAVIAYYAVLDLQDSSNGLAPDLCQAFSAVHNLSEEGQQVAPLFVARAGLDAPWINASIDRFVAKATSVGATVDLLHHPTGRHSFDISDDDARSRRIIRRTLSFLRDHLAESDEI